jgi:hypothetical protein
LGLSTPLSERSLIGAALLYLALPNLIFMAGWLTWPIALLLSTLLVTGLWHWWRGQNHIQTTNLVSTRQTALILAALALLWAYFGGAGHFVYANADWKTRDAVYADLILGDWPTAYLSATGQLELLRSAFAYFLPSALATSVLGIAHADALLYSWTALGVWLFLLLLPLPDQRISRVLASALIVAFFSGMDYLGVIIISGDTPIFPLRLEWWTHFSYSSLSGQLFWAPNHTLPLWLLAVILYRSWARSDFLLTIGIAATLTALWTPFAPISVLPYIAVHVWQHRLRTLKTIHLTQALFLLAWLAVIIPFFSLNSGDIPIKTGVAHADTRGNFAYAYLIFVLCEFALLWLLLLRAQATPSPSRTLLVISGAMLFALPFVFYGPSNDILLRGSAPPLLILLIFTLSSLFSAKESPADKSPERQQLRIGVLLLLAIGALTPLHEIARAITWPAWRPNYAISLTDNQRGTLPPHYAGRFDNAWLAWLMRTPHDVRRTHDLAPQSPSHQR